jgi:small subunit ribosomal protein S1
MVEKVVGEEDSKIDEGTGSPMWKYLKEEYDYKRPRRGDILYSEVLRIDDNEIIVDIGGKTEGVVPSADLQRMGEEAIDEISVGDKVPVYVLRPESADGDVIVSLNMARTMEDWRRAEKLYEDGAVFEGAVSGHNKGGLLVYYGKIRGFVPASQVAGLGRRTRYESRMDMLAKMEGQKLMLKVIEVDRQRRRLIFSERAASREWREKRKEELLNDLQEGDIRKGRVRNLCDFGAFVDLGGADGLIHISELSWRRVKHAREVLRVGDEVEAYVLRVDRERKRIGLSLKRLKPDPWHLVEEKYEAGQIVKGIITNVVDFGAFVRIEDGIEGLIHVSELSDGDFAPGDLVREGEELYVKILSIDADRQRMALSLKQAPTREEVEGEEALAETRAAATPEEVAVAPEAEAEAEVELEEVAEAAIEPAEEPPIMEEPVADVESAEAMAEAELEAAAEVEEELEAAAEPELEEPVSVEVEAEPEEEIEAAAEPEEEAPIVEEITPQLEETVEAAAEVEEELEAAAEPELEEPVSVEVEAEAEEEIEAAAEPEEEAPIVEEVTPGLEETVEAAAEVEEELEAAAEPELEEPVSVEVEAEAEEEIEAAAEPEEEAPIVEEVTPGPEESVEAAAEVEEELEAAAELEEDAPIMEEPTVEVEEGASESEALAEPVDAMVESEAPEETSAEPAAEAEGSLQSESEEGLASEEEGGEPQQEDVLEDGEGLPDLAEEA